MRRSLTILGLIFLLLGGGVTAVNFAAVGYPLSRVIQTDGRNAGISASAHYAHYINPSVVIFNLDSVSPSNTPMDVFRVFLQFAAEMKDRRFSRIELAHHGTTKFLVSGEYFAQLGTEYGEQNPVYTIRTFPEHLYRPDGNSAYGTWTGGLIGVLTRQMEDFNDFHRKWYIEDLTASD